MNRSLCWGMLILGLFSLSLDLFPGVSLWRLLWDIPVALFGLGLVLEPWLRKMWADSEPRSPEEYAAQYDE